MANFPLLKALGWVTGELLSPEQLNALNVMLPKIPNFLEGSSHTPSAPVNILGAQGLNVDTLRCGTATATTAFEFASVAAVTRSTHPLANNQIPAGTWTPETGAAAFVAAVAQNTVTGPPKLYVPLPQLPTGCEITGVGVRIKGAAGHTGLPGTMPRVSPCRLYTTTSSMALQYLGAVGIDASASHTAYQEWHTVQTGAFAHAYDMSSLYFAEITGEGSTLALTGMLVHAVSVTYTSKSANR